MYMISIIIPTFNEAENIGKLIRYLLSCDKGNQTEIIVSDGGSSDNTPAIAKQAGAIAIHSTQKGRAVQMNHGARIARGEILYFVHADCQPPNSFVEDILSAVGRGFSLGRYRTRFDSPRWILKCNAFFTRFDLFVCYGGDQTLFINKSLFDSLSGFDQEMMIMEEYDFVSRARKQGRYKIFQKNALVSARKYENNSWLAVQLAHKKVIKMYRKGASQQTIKEAYQNLLKWDKLN